MAALCGLKSGIPLIAGAGDKPAGTVGAGLASNGLLIDESASFAALSLCVDRFVPDKRFRTLENLLSPIEGFYLPSVFINGSGVTHEWFKDTFCEQEKIEAEEKRTKCFQIA
jgi:xylulokinase